MTFIPINPFDREFTELEPTDLQVLREVHEGWYIEYKSQTQSVRDHAKSLAAFANHYGGWIFYGVTDSRDGRNVAEDFGGLSSDDTARIIENLRNASKDHISPPPYYRHRVLDGPCAEIGLPDDRSIVVVQVPSGQNAPFIHSNGRIYRRVADSSDPVHETDRFVLDQLWKRGQRAQSGLEDFVSQEPMLASGESEISFVDIYMTPDPYGVMGRRTDLAFDLFVEIMNDISALEFNVPFDNYFTMSGGIVARQIERRDPYDFATLMWKHYVNGSSVVTLPFSSTDVYSAQSLNWLDGYHHGQSFLNGIRRLYSGCIILDINQLIQGVMSIARQQRHLLDRRGIPHPFYMKASLNNMWRRIPFLDTQGFIDILSQWGLPVIQFDKEFAPPGMSLENFRLVTQPVSGQVVEDGLIAFLGDILYALGIPAYDVAMAGGLFEVAGRAREVGRRRERASS